MRAITTNKELPAEFGRWISMFGSTNNGVKYRYVLPDKQAAQLVETGKAEYVGARR